MTGADSSSGDGPVADGQAPGDGPGPGNGPPAGHTPASVTPGSAGTPATVMPRSVGTPATVTPRSGDTPATGATDTRQAARHRPVATAPAARALGMQCTGSRLSPHPPAATAPSSAPAYGVSASRSTAHHHTAPSPSASPQRAIRPAMAPPPARRQNVTVTRKKGASTAHRRTTRLNHDRTGPHRQTDRHSRTARPTGATDVRPARPPATAPTQKNAKKRKPRPHLPRSPWRSPGRGSHTSLRPVSASSVYISMSVTSA